MINNSEKKDRLSAMVLELAEKHPEICQMKTAWHLLRFQKFEYSSVRAELGMAPSFAQITKALRFAQKTIRERPQSKRRIVLEA